MRRLAIGLALLLAVFAPACGGGSGDTLVVIKVKGTVTGPVRRIELALTLGGAQMAMHTLTEPNGAPITLPTTALIGVRNGEGRLDVVATAYTDNDVVLDDGSATGTVVRGETETIEITLGQHSVPDGGVDADGGGTPLIDIMPDDTSFGVQIVGMTGLPAQFTVLNRGTGASATLQPMLTGTDPTQFSIVSATDTCTGQALAPSSSCLIEVVFAPTRSGDISAILQVSTGVGATLTGAGELPGDVRLTPTTKDFQGIPVNGASTAQTFTVSNQGSAATGLLSVNLAGADPGQFTIDSDGCSGTSLAATATCAIVARFLPTSAGNKLASLVVKGTPGGTTVSSLSGSGQRPARLTGTPTTADYGSVLVGSTSTPTTFTFRNEGDVATGALTTTAPPMADFAVMANDCTASLAPGAMCTISVRLDTTTRGVKQATLSVAATPGGTALVNLSGTVQTAATLVLNPPGATASLGSVVIGNTATANFTLSNIGEVPSGAPSVSLAGADVSQYSITDNTCTGARMPNATCNIQIRFTPTSTGSKAATLSVSAAPGGVLATNLLGTGVPVGVLVMAPSAHDFLGVQVGTNSGTVPLVVTNSGGSSSGTLTTALAAGSEFSIVSDTCNGTQLPQGANCIVTVRFSPSNAGGKNDTLVVSASPGGMAVASLTGTGLTPAQLVVSPTAHAFASTLVGASSAMQTFTVTNLGGVASGTVAATLGGANANQWAIGANTCTAAIMPGATCTVVLTFRPGNAGPQSASLSVVGGPGGTATATLSGTGLAPAALSITPTPFSFGSVLVGQNSSAQTFTVRNSGDVDSVALTTSVTGPFAVFGTNACGAALAPGATCTIPVRFSPTTRAPASGMLTVSAGSVTGSVTLTGTGINAVLAIEPTSYNFNSVVVGASATQTFTISNTGDAASGVVSLALGGAAPVDFSLSLGTCVSGTTSLGIGASCTKVVTFMPSTTGARTATLTASASPGASVMSTLSGAGINVGMLAASPSSFNFNSVQVGQNSTTQTITVTNNGGAATGTLTVTLGAPFAITMNTCTGTALGAGSSCTVVTRFSPTARGAASDSLLISDGTLMASSSLSGLGIDAILTITPAPHSFPGVAVATSTAQTFTIRNTGDAPSSTITLGVSGGQATDFVLAGGGCASGTVTLGAGMQCTKVVTFTPAMAGARMTTLSASASTGGAATATLSGLGLAPPLLTISPTSRDFGSWDVNATTGATTFTITNTGGVTTQTLSASITGQFTIATNNCAGIPLAAAETCTVSARFAPTSSGMKTGTLTVTDGSVSVGAGLSGLGTLAILTISETSWDFGNQHGSTAKTHLFTITNTGNGTSGQFTIMISGPQAADFTYGGGTCAFTGAPTVLAAGASCNRSIWFYSGALGPRTATLSSTNTFPGGMVSATLMGNGT